MLFPHLDCSKLNREKKEKLNISNELYDKWTQKGKPIVRRFSGFINSFHRKVVNNYEFCTRFFAQVLRNINRDHMTDRIRLKVSWGK